MARSNLAFTRLPFGGKFIGAQDSQLSKIYIQTPQLQRRSQASVVRTRRQAFLRPR